MALLSFVVESISSSFRSFAEGNDLYLVLIYLVWVGERYVQDLLTSPSQASLSSKLLISVEVGFL